MPTSTNNNSNSTINLSLQGFTSMLIGVYFLIAAYVIELILAQFLIDDSPMMLMSPQIIEILILLVVFLTILFSSLALYFSGKRKAKKENYTFWNLSSKKLCWKYLGFIFVGCSLLFYLKSINLVAYLTPAFLFLYGFLLILFKKLDNKNNYLLIGICFLLGLTTLMIPSYWNSSLLILGVAHIIYGTLKN